MPNRVTKQNVCGSSDQENRSQNIDTLHMLTESIRKANARRLQEETNRLIKEFIYATLLKEGAPNVCQNQKEVGSNHGGKMAHFVLEVKRSNGGQMCTL